MMKVTWGPTSLGMMHKVVDESEVMQLMEALTKLNMNPSAEMLDNDSPKV